MPSVDTTVVEREIKVNAAPETVFSYLVEEAKLRSWMSIGGAWNPRPGDAFRIEMTKEDVASGRYLEVQAPSRVVFTWGWEGADSITKPGSSTVEITLKPDGTGTLVKFVHRGLPTPESAASHAHGWDHYLQRLSIAAAGGDPGPDKFQE
jgi:uncharacterized protein YndB with AHSA1/START domain